MFSMLSDGNFLIISKQSSNYLCENIPKFPIETFRDVSVPLSGRNVEISMTLQQAMSLSV